MRRRIHTACGAAGQAAAAQSQVPDLGRRRRSPTSSRPFSFDEYFPADGNFEWDVPEGVLDPRGRARARSSTNISTAVHQAETTATGPAPFTVKETSRTEGGQDRRQVGDRQPRLLVSQIARSARIGGYFKSITRARRSLKGRRFASRSDALLSPSRTGTHDAFESTGDRSSLRNPWHEQDLTAIKAH